MALAERSWGSSTRIVDVRTPETSWLLLRRPRLLEKRPIFRLFFGGGGVRFSDEMRTNVETVNSREVIYSQVFGGGFRQ